MKLLATLAVSVLGVAKDEICPSDAQNGGCYTQSATWVANQQVTCDMTNADCLPITCNPGSINAKFRADLFDEGNDYLNELSAGTKELTANSQLLTQNDPLCGFSVQNGFLVIDWQYSACSQYFNVNFLPATNPGDVDQIEYTLNIASPGSKPGDIIEFYVDHQASATCTYDADVTIQGSGFWVNQEDVEAAQSSTKDLTENFDCSFFSADARTASDQIGATNIVNMGDTIFGRVTSTADMPGLVYTLQQVRVNDETSGSTKYFDVIENALPNSAVSANTDTSANVSGGSIDFDWMSFGFQGLSDQNELSIQCDIRLSLGTQTAISCEWSDQEKRVPVGSQIADLRCPAGQSIQVQSAKYGRWDSTTCWRDRPNQMKLCTVAGTDEPAEADHYNKAAQQCNGKQECDYHGSNGVNGDPCRGIAKYTVIDYICV